MDKEDKKIAPEKGQHQVSESDYEKNLETIVGRLKKTGAKLCFAGTPAFPSGSDGRIQGDEVRYNDIARRVMQKNGVAIDDLYAFAQPRLAEIQLPANVHFKPEGYRQLAEQVAASIVTAVHAKEQAFSHHSM